MANCYTNNYIGAKTVSRCSTLNNSENIKHSSTLFLGSVKSYLQTRYKPNLKIQSRDTGIYNNDVFSILVLVRVKRWPQTFFEGPISQKVFGVGA